MDEVGVGCLAGPVVVCAVGIKKDFHDKAHKNLSNLRESKLLSSGQRESFAKQLIREHGFLYAITSCSPKVIDKINIYQATRLAMRQSLKKIQPPRSLKTMVLVDGKHKLAGIKYDQRASIKGDRKIFAIACASIIAKVHRDRYMTRLYKKYPLYGFEKHKGYGTKMHTEAILKNGLSEIHRKSFCKNLHYINKVV